MKDSYSVITDTFYWWMRRAANFVRYARTFSILKYNFRSISFLCKPNRHVCLRNMRKSLSLRGLRVRDIRAMSEQIIYRNNPLGAPAVGDRADEGLTCLSYETKYLGDSTLATVKKKASEEWGRAPLHPTLN